MSSKIVYKDLKQYTREELKEIVREQQDEIESQKHTVLLFDEENKIIKSNFYDLDKKYESLEDKYKTLEKTRDRILEIIATQEEPSPVITQLQEALGVAISE
jgi:predicted nuclease with TOPRIM domain